MGDKLRIVNLEGLNVGTNSKSGRKLWLRPGKLYLFGRTAAERTFTSVPTWLERSNTDC